MLTWEFSEVCYKIVKNYFIQQPLTECLLQAFVLGSGMQKKKLQRNLCLHESYNLAGVVRRCTKKASTAPDIEGRMNLCQNMMRKLEFIQCLEHQKKTLNMLLSRVLTFFYFFTNICILKSECWSQKDCKYQVVQVNKYFASSKQCHQFLTVFIFPEQV